ncbi:CHAT domain-containing protein [Algoriphagus taiwanensis]
MLFRFLRIIFISSFFILISKSAISQNADSILLQIEKKQFQSNFDQVIPLIERLSADFSDGKINLSPSEKLRLAAIQMAFFNAKGEGENGLALADSLAKLPELKSLPEEAWASIFFQKGDIYLYEEKMLESGRNYEKAIQLFERQSKPNFAELALCHNNLGYVQDILGFQNRSQESYYRAFEIWKTSYLDDFSNIATVLNNLIFAEIEYGNYEAAEDLLRFFDSYVREIKTSFALKEVEELDLELKLLLNYSRFYGATKADQKLDQILNRAEILLRNAPKEFFNDQWVVLAAMLEEAGFLQKELKNFQAGAEYYERMKNLPLSGFFQMKYQANLAILYYDAGENEKALVYARKSLQLLEQFGFGGSSSFSLKVLQADLLNRLGKETESVTMLEGMLSDLLGKSLSSSSIPELTYRDFKQLNNERYLTVLIKSAQIFQRIGQKNRSESDIKSSLTLFRLAAEMFQEYYLKGSYTQSLEEIHRQIQEGIYSLWQEKNLLTESEKYQLLALLERNESQQGWKKFLSKNEEYLGSTSEILRDLNYKNLEINQQEPSASQEKSLQEELKAIEKRMEEEASYRFFTGGNFDLREFQIGLSPDLSVLKYVVTERQVFALLVQRDGTKVIPLAALETVNSWVGELRASLSKLDDSYRLPAQTLYRLLIAPLENSLSETLFILPDDLLHSLPFEALIDADGRFLVERYVLSYQQSFRQMAFQSPNNETWRTDFLVAFAPDYQGTKYRAIQNNREEVDRLATSLSGKSFMGKEATKTAFVESFTDFQVHHLAMHAEQNPSNFEESALIFSEGEKLLLRELYQMNFPSELVVLSACNTGIGTLMPGEGLMSLSKALNLAGVKSTIYSLWEVPDRETAELMVDFYDQIQKGQPKNVALTLAKRNFLQKNPLKKHPIFWAGFVLNGNTDAMEVTSPTRIWIAGLGLTALIVFGIAFSIRKARS